MFYLIIREEKVCWGVNYWNKIYIFASSKSNV